MDAATILQRCTRDGVVQWQQVAKQLGCSVERAKVACGYHAPRQDPQQIAEPEPREQPGLRNLIMTTLGRLGPLHAEAIAARVGSPTNSVRMRLSQLKAAGLVESDGPQRGRGGEPTWTLTAAGRITVFDRPGSTGQGAPAEESKAA